MNLPDEWHNPPAEFSLAPFWFWNDALDETELARQMDEFQAHGVQAFVIHPRVGLPRDMGWMSDNLLNKMRFAIQQAQKRGMWVILYDEGMYPSGSSSGQVVAEDAAYQCRGFVRINLETVQPNSIEQGIQIDENGQPVLQDYQTLIATVGNYAIIQRPVQAVIRGLHYTTEPEEDTPPAIDLLNPEAVHCFIRLVYQRYYDEFGAYFGNVIQAIFTDEPHLLGRLEETDAIIPGTIDSMAGVNAFLGYDFTPYLPAVWDDPALRAEYERALAHVMETTYYAQLYQWCEEHHISLTGHPAEPDAIHQLRYFHIPGQDIVWRFIEPDAPSALEGRQSTQAKVASSAMLHQNRRRNLNEFCGAYGHELTFEEMRWLAHWLLIRGCNLLVPHAFYYSVRGARYDERPPDVGLHSAWWDDRFTQFARECQRLCWLNTDSEQVCYVGIQGVSWQAAKICFENQIDFNYILQDEQYAVVIDDETPDPVHIKRLIPQNLFTDVHAPGLRVRHVRKAGYHWYMLFNEVKTPLTLNIDLPDSMLFSQDAITAFSGGLTLAGHEFIVLVQQG